MEEAIKDFKAAEEAFSDSALRDCLMPVAMAIRDFAKRLVRPTNSPKAPGYLGLKDAIFAAEGNEKSPTVIVGVDRKKAPHAHLVEFKHDLWRGGKKRKGQGHFIKEVKAHPYLRPAFDAIRRFQAKSIAAMQINDRIIKKLTRRRRGSAGTPGGSAPGSSMPRQRDERGRFI